MLIILVAISTTACVVGVVAFVWLESTRVPRFKPQVFYELGVSVTTLQLKDTLIVWCPLPLPGGGHAVDLGYDHDGKLVGVKIWADVQERASLVNLRKATLS